MTEKRVYSEFGQGNVFISGPAVNKVYETSDYSIFQFSKFNRNVLLRKEMLEQAKRGFIAPVIVNEHLMVIDGQHRVKASEKVGVPVRFMVVEGLDENDIVNMNTVQKPWTLHNFIEAFANQGFEEYVKLLNLLNDVYGNVTVVTQVSLDVTDSKPVRNKVEKGEFEFKNYEKTVEFLHFLKTFKEKTKTAYKTKLSLALYELFKIEKLDLNRLISKVIETGLDEELKVKTLDKTEALRDLLDAYNKHINKSNNRYINYHVTSYGTIVIDEEKYDWTKQEEIA